MMLKCFLEIMLFLTVLDDKYFVVLSVKSLSIQIGCNMMMML